MELDLDTLQELPAQEGLTGGCRYSCQVTCPSTCSVTVD